MQAAQHLIEIRIAVQSRDKKKLKKALDDLDDSQLLAESIEPEVFAIYEWMLSDPVATAAPGIERIFTNFTGDIHKYSKSQIAQLVNIFDKNQSKYVQQMLRHAAADFTARQNLAMRGSARNPRCASISASAGVAAPGVSCSTNRHTPAAR